MAFWNTNLILLCIVEWTVTVWHSKNPLKENELDARNWPQEDCWEDGWCIRGRVEGIFVLSLFGTFLAVGIQTGLKLLGVSCARDAYVNTQQSCMSVYLKSTLQNLISYQHKDLASDVHLVHNPILVWHATLSSWRFVLVVAYRLFAQKQACLHCVSGECMLPRRILRWQLLRSWRRRLTKTCLWRSFGSDLLQVWQVCGICITSWSVLKLLLKFLFCKGQCSASSSLWWPHKLICKALFALSSTMGLRNCPGNQCNLPCNNCSPYSWVSCIILPCSCIEMFPQCFDQKKDIFQFCVLPLESSNGLFQGHLNPKWEAFQGQLFPHIRVFEFLVEFLCFVFVFLSFCVSSFFLVSLVLILIWFLLYEPASCLSFPTAISLGRNSVGWLWYDIDPSCC